MNTQFINFIDSLAKASGQYALCEAIKDGYKTCYEASQFSFMPTLKATIRRDGIPVSRHDYQFPYVNKHTVYVPDEKPEKKKAKASGTTSDASSVADKKPSTSIPFPKKSGNATSTKGRTPKAPEGPSPHRWFNSIVGSLISFKLGISKVNENDESFTLYVPKTGYPVSFKLINDCEGYEATVDNGALVYDIANNPAYNITEKNGKLVADFKNEGRKVTSQDILVALHIISKAQENLGRPRFDKDKDGNPIMNKNPIPASLRKEIPETLKKAGDDERQPFNAIGKLASHAQEQGKNTPKPIPFK